MVASARITAVPASSVMVKSSGRVWVRVNDVGCGEQNRASTTGAALGAIVDRWVLVTGSTVHVESLDSGQSATTEIAKETVLHRQHRTVNVSYVFPSCTRYYFCHRAEYDRLPI